MNLHKFQFFTYIYFIILMITVIISSVIKKYDFLLGIYLFTVPVLVVGFITVWFQSNNKHISKQGFSEKLTNDILLHWIPFFTFMYILFVVQPKINNQLWFWLGYSLVIVSSIFYFLLNGGTKGIENNYNHSFLQMIIIFIAILLLTTIFTYYKLK